MAKKMLINADMLLATPRRQEPIVQIEQKVEEEKIDTPPSRLPRDVPSVSSTSILVEQPIVMPQPTSDNKKTVAITSVQRGLKTGETRATFIVKEDALEKIKAIAYWDRQNIKDIVQTAIEAYIQQYENVKGTVLPIP